MKPAGAQSVIHSGIQNSHKPFWKNLKAVDVRVLYYGLSFYPGRVFSMLEINPPAKDLESRVTDYLKLMIGNIQINELSLFLRFVTGARCVLCLLQRCTSIT